MQTAVVSSHQSDAGRSQQPPNAAASESDKRSRVAAETHEGSSSSKLADLRAKADCFKRSLQSTAAKDVRHNSSLLFQVLKTICTYHGKDLRKVIQYLDDGDNLDLSRLRFKFCNTTTIDKLLSQDN